MKNLETKLVVAGFALLVISCNNAGEKQKGNNQDSIKINSSNVTQSENSDKFDINNIAVSDADLGDFPYFKLPEEYAYADPDHYQNGNGKGLTMDYDKEYFLYDGVYLPIEGETFKGHINLDRNLKDKAFAPLALQKGFDDLITKMGGVNINNGIGYKGGEKDRILAMDPQAEKNGYMNSSQYFDNIHTYVIRKPDYNVWVQYNLGGETGYITVLKTKEFENKMSILKADEIQKDLKEKGKAILHINFDTDKATLKTDGKDAVSEISKALQADKNLKISINGYTDKTGNEAHNLELSKQRAETVKSELTKSGIEAKRLTTEGFGQTNPIADNNSENGKAQNRRVELVKTK